MDLMANGWLPLKTIAIPNSPWDPVVLMVANEIAIGTSIRVDRIAMVFNISQPLTKRSIVTEHSGLLVGKCFLSTFIFVAPRVYNCQEFLLSIPPLLPSAITKLANNVVSWIWRKKRTGSYFDCSTCWGLMCSAMCCDFLAKYIYILQDKILKGISESWNTLFFTCQCLQPC